jgi:hypothetical protein
MPSGQSLEPCKPRLPPPSLTKRCYWACPLELPLPLGTHPKTMAPGTRDFEWVWFRGLGRPSFHSRPMDERASHLLSCLLVAGRRAGSHGCKIESPDCCAGSPSAPRKTWERSMFGVCWCHGTAGSRDNGSGSGRRDATQFRRNLPWLAVRAAVRRDSPSRPNRTVRRSGSSIGEI